MSKRDNTTLVGFIFDSAESYCANDFETTIDRIAGYVADKYNEGTDICLFVLNFKKPTFKP